MPPSDFIHSDNRTSTRSWTGRVFIAASLDGYIACESGDIEWLTNPPPIDHIQPTAHRTVDTLEQHMARVDCIVMGRGTYEKCRTLDKWPYPGKPIFVLSTRIEIDPAYAGLDVRVVQKLEDVPDALASIEARTVYVDGGKVIQSFLQQGWIAEVILTQVPILLGEGIPLFGSLRNGVHLRLVATNVIENGMISSHYLVEQ